MSKKRELDITKVSSSSDAVSRNFANRIIGQPEATAALTAVLEKYHSGLYDRTKPIASLLFLGPTGTGKTATVETFAEGLFGARDVLLKIDCAEYQHSHEISRLVGSPPGYLGHRETHPYITTAKLQSLRTVEHSFTVILLDEIEKASDSLWNLLLGILDKGTLTLGTNEAVDMCSTIIIMTSNVGSKELAAQAGDASLGFTSPSIPEIPTERLKDISVSAAKRKFLPEFLNRLDQIVMFNTLSRGDIAAIFQLELDRLQANVIANAKTLVEIIVTPAAKEQIITEGYDRKYGARYLKRTIEKRVLLPITRSISTKQVEPLDKVIVHYDGKNFVYTALETT